MIDQDLNCCLSGLLKLLRLEGKNQTSKRNLSWKNWVRDSYTKLRTWDRWVLLWLCYLANFCRSCAYFFLWFISTFKICCFWTITDKFNFGIDSTLLTEVFFKCGLEIDDSKGQSISKFMFGVFKSSKEPTKIF